MTYAKRVVWSCFARIDTEKASVLALWNRGAEFPMSRASMSIRFTKGSGKFDWMVVLRDGAVVEEIDCPKQGIIPHDMVHYAVESVLQRRGFLGRVVAGEEATFRMPAETESEGVERLVEVFQADGWSGWNTAPADLRDLYQVTCSARGSVPLSLSDVDVEAIRARILELTAAWKSLPVGASLALEL